MGEENGAGATGAGDGWFFPEVELCLSNFNFVGCPASARFYRAVNVALKWTDVTEHG